MSDKSSLVATCQTHQEAEQAVKDLEKSGFNMKDLSIVGKDYHTDEHVVGYYTAGDSMKHFGKFGAFWGGLFGFLVGSAFFWVPGVGPLMVAGPLVSWILGTLEGAAIGGGIGVLMGALAGLGIPKESILKYETAIKANKYLLIAHSTPDQVEHARDVLAGKSGIEVDIHEPAAAAV